MSLDAPTSTFWTKATTFLSPYIGVDWRSVALFRVSVGLMLVLDCLMRMTDLVAHYTDDGILPRVPYIEKFASDMHASIFMGSGEPFWPALLLTLGAIIGLLMMLGYKSRLMAFLGWVLIISAHNRNPMILNGGDVLFRLLLFWAIFLPLGRRFALDQALAKDQQDHTPSPTYFGAPAFAITMQIALVYWSTALLKTGKEWWPEGTASYYALALEQFTTSFGMWMAQQYTLLHWSTYFVYFLEMIGPFFFFFPFLFGPIRTLAVAAFMVLHLNFDLTMRLGLFPWIDIAGLTILLPSWFWDTAKRLTGGDGRPLQIYYDESCQFCRKAALIARTFLTGDTAIVAAAQDSQDKAVVLQREKSWIVIGSDGQQHYRYDALKTLLRESPIWGLVMRRMPLDWFNKPGDMVYRWISDHRPQLGKFTAQCLPYRSKSPAHIGFFTQIAALFFIGYIALWNIKTIPRFNVIILSPWDQIAQYLRLDQKWNMFAPYPLKDDGWYVVPGKLNDDTEIDVFKAEQSGLKPDDYPPVSWEKPDQVSATYKNARWRKYMMNIWQKKKKDHRLYYGKYLCRTFNRNRPFDKKLANFEVIFVKEKTPPAGEPLTTEKVTIWRHDCFKKAD